MTDDGENPAVAPAGRPVAVSPTVCGVPEVVVVVMVLVALVTGVPATAAEGGGEAAIEKSPGGGGGAPDLNRGLAVLWVQR